jgi:hypothetical protein
MYFRRIVWPLFLLSICAMAALPPLVSTGGTTAHAAVDGSPATVDPAGTEWVVIGLLVVGASIWMFRPRRRMEPVPVVEKRLERPQE